MRTILFLCFFIFWNYELVGQDTLITFQDYLYVNYSLRTNKIPDNSSSVKVKPIGPSKKKDNRLRINSASIKDGDMILRYDLFKFRKIEKKKKMYIQLELVIEDTIANTKTYSLPNQLIGDTINSNKKTQNGKSIVWENWIEMIKPTSKDLELKLIGHLLSDKPIPDTITFGKKDKLPYFLCGSIGAGLFIASFPIKNDAREEERLYYNQTFDEEFINAANSYQKANSKHKTANFLKNLGTGVMATAIVGYAIHNFIHKKREDNYNYYAMQDGFSILPIFQIAGTINDQIGIQLSYAF